MLNDLNDRLGRAAGQKAQRDKLQRRTAELEQAIRQARIDVARAKAQADKEEHDLERLEGASLTGLFMEILGNKEERLRKERQEALAAQLKHHEASVRLETLEDELRQTQEETASVSTRGDDYGALLKEKEAAIGRDGGKGARELLQFGEREHNLQWQLQQYAEAIAAGRQADAALMRVIDSLRSAEGWGTWDMFGGGLIATAIKHSRIDDARNQVAVAQQELGRFQRELKDVAPNIRLEDVGIDSFSKFADFFFDGLIADWVVQSKIHHSLQNVEEALGQVRRWLHWLDQNVAQAKKDQEALKAERAAFIERFGAPGPHGQM